MLTTDQARDAWARALTLPERATLASHLPASRPASGAAERAARLLARWRRQAPFDDAARLAERLRSDGLDPDSFAALLSLDVSSLLDERALADQWPARVRDVLHEGDAPRAGGLPWNDAEAGMLVFVRPFVEHGYEALVGALREVPALATLPLPPERAALLAAPALAQLLGNMTSRMLLLELNVARLQGRLDGETPAARFASFVALLRDPGYRAALLAEYSVLARAIVAAVDRWHRHHLELFTRLAQDAPRLVSVCGLPPGASLGRLIGVEGGAGDSHDGGRSVAILHFEGGHRLVYKPRSLAVDVRFDALLEWLDRQPGTPALRRVRVLDCGSYGWVEFVDQSECADEEGVRRFYERLGGLLAVLYALDATDMHLENLVACGEDPVAVDLEALFHPRFAPPAGVRHSAPASLGWHAYHDSVMRVGLLPSRAFARAGSEGVELSGVGGAEGQLSPDEQPVLELSGTDEARVTRRRVALPVGRNQPRLRGAVVHPAPWVESIVRGFQQVHAAMRREAATLLADDGLLARFADVPVRVVMRHTRIYGIMLRESFHPDLLRDALDRTRHFDHLWATATDDPWSAAVIRSEQRALEAGDIPLFHTRPGSGSVWTTEGEELGGVFARASLDVVRARIARMDQADADRQAWYIRASLASLDRHAAHQQGAVALFPSVPRLAKARDAVLPPALQAVQLGERLAGQAIEDGRDVTWMGLSLVSEQFWAVQPVTDDLYGGRAGIALFLMYLDAVRPDPRMRRLARLVVDSIKDRILAPGAPVGTAASATAMRGELGAFRSVGGSVFLLAHAGALWGDTAAWDAADRLLREVPEGARTDATLDVIGGVAGAILAASALLHSRPGAIARRALTACADRLLETADIDDGRWSWRTELPAHRPLTGFSHGAAGIAYALAWAHTHTGEARYAEAARGALRYELANVRAGGCWPDYREIAGPAPADGQWPSMFAWCHGAPGSGMALARLCRGPLARLLAAPDGGPLGDALEALSVEAALATASHGFIGNHSLCHGALGNLELLTEVTVEPVNGRIDRLALRDAVLADMDARGILCGIPNGMETPGLMMGTAGVGWGLLRMAHPDRVPNVLLLDPPGGRGAA